LSAGGAVMRMMTLQRPCDAEIFENDNAIFENDNAELTTLKDAGATL
jgi:hypothetical protein